MKGRDGFVHACNAQAAVDADAQIIVANRINEATAEIVAAHPGRFGAFAVVPHDDPVPASPMSPACLTC